MVILTAVLAVGFAAPAVAQMTYSWFHSVEIAINGGEVSVKMCRESKRNGRDLFVFSGNFSASFVCYLPFVLFFFYSIFGLFLFV